MTVHPRIVLLVLVHEDVHIELLHDREHLLGYLGILLVLIALVESVNHFLEGNFALLEMANFCSCRFSGEYFFLVCLYAINIKLPVSLPFLCFFRSLIRNGTLKALYLLLSSHYKPSKVKCVASAIILSEISLTELNKVTNLFFYIFVVDVHLVCFEQAVYPALGA